MDELRFVLMAFSAIFVVVDPIAAVPVFLSMTADDSIEKRRTMARRAALTAAIILLSFAFAGGVIFSLFGISLGAFKIAGGVMIGLTALDMMRAKVSSTRSTPEERREGAEKEDVAVVPMGIPMLAGPGAIATVMVLMGQSEWRPLRVLGVVGAIIATALVTWLMLRAGSLANRFLSETGMRILGRIMGLILAAIAVEFIAHGLADLFPAMAAKA